MPRHFWCLNREFVHQDTVSTHVCTRAGKHRHRPFTWRTVLYAAVRIEGADQEAASMLPPSRHQVIQYSAYLHR